MHTVIQRIALSTLMFTCPASKHSNAYGKAPYVVAAIFYLADNITFIQHSTTYLKYLARKPM